MGILIAIDGVDASGKETQSKMLFDRLTKSGKSVRSVSFPMYESESSYFVKEYLAGSYGKNPSDVNAYAASMLFAADRFATYRTDWGKNYENGDIIIADRYVTSNLIHQAGKISDKSEKKAFIEWEEDFEYNKLSLPRPDITIFLDMPTEYALKLMSGRSNKIDGSSKKDIHESNREYLEKSYKNASDISDMLSWKRICCVDSGRILSPEEIHSRVFEAVSSLLLSE